MNELIDKIINKFNMYNLLDKKHGYANVAISYETINSKEKKMKKRLLEKLYRITIKFVNYYESNFIVVSDNIDPIEGQ